jgi:hypothetical protein
MYPSALPVREAEIPSCYPYLRVPDKGRLDKKPVFYNALIRQVLPVFLSENADT